MKHFNGWLCTLVIVVSGKVPSADCEEMIRKAADSEVFAPVL